MQSASILSSGILASFFLHLSEAHGGMVTPPVWSVAAGEAGILYPGSVLDAYPDTYSWFWFTNFTHIPGERTLDPSMTSFPQLEEHGVTQYGDHPWMAPGTAPVHGPCGAYGGNPHGCHRAPPGGLQDTESRDIGKECGNGGWPGGPLAEDYFMSPGFPDMVTTEWKAGSVEEAGHWMAANHGGGYSYRLCKVPEEGMKGLTEECFQQGHLEFFGDKQWIRRYDGEAINDVEAVRTTEGTFPEGSQWTRSPIPNCLLPEESFNQPFPSFPSAFGTENPSFPCALGTQHPSPAFGMEGYNMTYVSYDQDGEWNGMEVVDKLVVPEDLTPGDYVLSFRLVTNKVINDKCNRL